LEIVIIFFGFRKKLYVQWNKLDLCKRELVEIFDAKLFIKKSLEEIKESVGDRNVISA